MVSADRAADRIAAARAKAIADAKKGAISADRAEDRINAAVAKAIAEARAAMARPVVSAPTTTTTTNNNAAREQAARDQAARDQAARDQAARDQAARDQAAAQAAAQVAIDEANRKRAEQEERDRQAAAAAAEQARQEAIARMPRPLTSSTREPVKYATPSDVLIDTNDLPIDLILKLTLEKIGGLELISLVRHDTVNGQNIVYRPVKNIPQLAIQYNPQNIVKMPDSADSYFKNFPIKLENHIQQTTNELPPLVAYIDPVTENVIIDVVNTKRDYEIEVQMISSGKVFDDIIYEEDN
jgi:flagellar biosynthesis GTPase FlhF